MITTVRKSKEVHASGSAKNRRSAPVAAGGEPHPHRAIRFSRFDDRRHNPAMASPPVVYVIDGDSQTRQKLLDLVSTMNLHCETFRSVAAFVDRCDPSRAGCVVTELRLPDHNGLELQQQLQSRAWIWPVIFLTAYPDVSLAVQAMRDGAVHFLEKPLRSNELWNAILEAVELSARQRRLEHFRDQARQYTRELSSKEHSILRLIGQGKSNQEVAQELGVCVRTVELHRAALFRKLGVDSLRGLIELGILLNWAEGREPAESIPVPHPC